MTSTATKKKITAALFALTLPFGLAACGDSGRASKEEFQDGMEAMLDDIGYDRESMKAQGMDDGQLDDYYSCIVDTSYDDLSDTFVNGVANNDQNAPMESGDADVMQSAISECIDSLEF